MFVTAKVEGFSRPNAIVVPQLAVQQGSNGHLVYVIKQDGTAEVRPVVVGDYQGDKDIVIVDGLQGRRPGGGRRRAEGGAGQAGGIVEPGQPARRQGARRRRRRRSSRLMFTHFFIDRPILSSVISILIVLAGAVSMSVSPIEQYPDMSPPQVTIDARYPGATADVIANNVAAPIETQLNGVDNLLYYYSTSSSSGNVADRGGVQARQQPGHQPGQRAEQAVSQAMPQLPQVVTQQGLIVDKKSPSIMMVVSVYSPDERYDAAYIDNYANLYVLEELKRVPGANRSSVVRLARHRHARLAAPRPHGAARHHRAGGGRRDPEPEPGLRHRPARRAADRPGRRAAVRGHRAGPAAASPRSSRTSSCARRRKAPRSCA